MIFQQSKRQRRLVGRLEDGEDCIERLTEFCAEHGVRAAEIRAVGRLSEIEVVRFEPDAEDYVPVFTGAGNFDLVTASGNVSRLGEEVVVRLQSVLAVEGPVESQLITGQLRSGNVLEFEFVMEIFEDLELERGLDSETGMLALQTVRRTDEGEEGNAPASSAEGPPLEGQSMSWDDAAEASKESAETPDEGGHRTASDREGEREEDGGAAEEIYGDMDLDEPLVEAGDILDHPKLGRCHVIKVEDEQYIHIRLPQGKIRKLSLNVVEIDYIGEENGRNVFEAQVNK